MTPVWGKAEPVLEIWTSSENIKKALEKLTPAFEKKYQAKVQVTVLNKELKTQFQTAGLTSKGPDILCWAHDVVGELASSGLIEPIIMPPELKTAFVDHALESFKYDGKYFGYPYDVESLALITNPTLMPEAPKSFESLYESALNIRKSNSNNFGFLYDIKSFFFSFPLLAAGGGEVFEKDEFGRPQTNRPGLASQQMIQNAHFLQKLVKSGVIASSTDRSIAFELFQNGRLAAMIDGPWAISDLKKSHIPFEVSPLPTLNGHPARPFLGTHGFMIRRSSDVKKLAKELIENYLVTKEGIAELYRQDPRSPSRKDSLEILKKELSSRDIAILKAFLASAENAVPMPNIPEMGAIWPVMGEALEFMIQNQKEPKEVLPRAVGILLKR